MRDLDSAVGRLDNIFMSLYAIIAILIIAVALVSSTPGSGVFPSNRVCRRLNCSPSSPERELLSSVREPFTLKTRASCLTPNRSELAYRRKSRRGLDQYHIPLHQAPV